MHQEESSKPVAAANPEDQENRLSTDAEVAALEETFVQSMKGGRGRSNPYVALPAPGHDVHGLWHCFGAGHRSGYATHAVALHWALDRELKVQTQLIPHRNMDIDIDEFPPDRYEMLFDWNKNAVGHGHIVFSSFPPEVSVEMEGLGPPLVPYIAFEGTTVSEFTKNVCNSDAFRQVWVVHPFVKEALVAGGVQPDRVYVAPPLLFGGPWAGQHLSDVMMTAATEAPPGEIFTFGAMGTWHERKGFHDLVRAYFSSFRRDEPVQLVIRTSTFGKKRTIREFKDFLTEEIAGIAAEFGDANFPDSKAQPRLKLLLGTDATDAEVIQWLGSIDCFASPSYGEGLGIPHIWAKGQGVPLISTGFGAVGELVNSIADSGGTDDSIVPFELTDVHEEMHKIALMFSRETKWGGYKVEDFAAAMREQFERGIRRDLHGAHFVRERHGVENAVRHVKQGLASLVDPQLRQDWGIG